MVFLELLKKGTSSLPSKFLPTTFKRLTIKKRLTMAKFIQLGTGFLVSLDDVVSFEYQPKKQINSICVQGKIVINSIHEEHLALLIDDDISIEQNTIVDLIRNSIVEF